MILLAFSYPLCGPAMRDHSLGFVISFSNTTYTLQRIAILVFLDHCSPKQLQGPFLYFLNHLYFLSFFHLNDCLFPVGPETGMRTKSALLAGYNRSMHVFHFHFKEFFNCLLDLPLCGSLL